MIRTMRHTAGMRGIALFATGIAAAAVLLAPSPAQAQTGGCLTHHMARDVASNGERRVDVESHIASIAPATAAATIHLPVGRAYYLACDGVHHMAARYWHTDPFHPKHWILQLTRWESGAIYP